MEGSRTLEKSLEFSGTFFFMPKKALCEDRNHLKRIEKLVEYSRIYGLVNIQHMIAELFPDYPSAFLKSIYKSKFS